MIITVRHNSLQRFFEAIMTRMHNPPHPGEVLREYLGDITITEAAVKLGVNRVTLSRVVSGVAGVSADMAYRLAQAFGTSAEMWAGMQMQYDLYQAGKVKRPKIERLAA
jgi:addiction module HigA family antidote